MTARSTVKIGAGSKVSIADVANVARHRVSAHLSGSAVRQMKRSNLTLLQYVDRRVPIYGLSTQFGDQVKMIDDYIKEKDDRRYRQSIRDRQINLVRSHNCGVGEEAPVDAVRGAMLLRAHCLSLGYSGVRRQVVDSLLTFLRRDISPVVRRYGSIGASGDLIPLSAIAAALVGEDVEVWHEGKKTTMGAVGKHQHVTPLALDGREGLALINGTSFMTSMTALAVHDLEILFHNMMLGISVSLECLSVIDSAYEPLVHKLKNHSGSIDVNAFIIKAWKGSKLIRRLGDEREKVGNGSGRPAAELNNLQDYYSLRSVSQGFGPFKENLDRSLRWVENEINSVNDNPIIDSRKKQVLHGANFMGYYITEVCDTLKMDIAQASTWLHAILANFVHPRKNFGLPTNLVRQSNVYSGFRPLQILAAALAVENRKFAQSHQAYTLPTEGDNQDVNSLGTHASFDLTDSVNNLSQIVAIFVLAAAQAVELRGLNLVSVSGKKLHNFVRGISSILTVDRSTSVEIRELAKGLIGQRIR